MSPLYNNWKALMIAAFIFTVMTAGVSADMGRGQGYHGQMHHRQGWHHRGYGAPGWGACGDLSKDDIQKLDTERQAFFENTKDLRREVYQKRLELASEMAKQNPDPAKAAAIQKGISDTQAQLAQKRLDHLFRIRKINPDLGMGFGGGSCMGLGMMQHGKMGFGSLGKWENHDCPYGGHRGGYGKGHGTMGPRGWERDASRQYHRGPGSVSE